MKTNTASDFESLRLLLCSICLRRNKAVLPLSESTEHVYELEFLLSEREEYNRLGHACKEAIDMAVSGHKTKEAHQTVLETLLRLRLFCNNGSFFGASSSGFPTDFEEAGSLLQQNGEAICHYCSCDILSFSGSDDPSFGCLTQCHRLVCGECVARYNYESRAASCCSICQMQHNLSAVTSNDNGQKGILANLTHPSKLITLCEDIQKHSHEGKR